MKYMFSTIPTISSSYPTKRNYHHLDCRQYVLPIFDDRFKYVPPTPKNGEAKLDFTVGANYTLKGVECDDFSMPTKEYQLLGVVDSLDGITLDSLIMKQISGPSSTIFSLTKSDCKKLGIDFQEGLQLFPKNLNWEKSQTENEVATEPTEIEFNPSDMSTYPRCHIDNTIRKFLIKISGFTRNGKKIYDSKGLEVIPHSLKIMTKHALGGNGLTHAMIGKYQMIPYDFVTPMISQTVEGCPFIDVLNNIYLEVDLTRAQSTWLPSWVEKTEDGKLGVGGLFIRGEFHEHFYMTYETYESVITNDIYGNQISSTDQIWKHTKRANTSRARVSVDTLSGQLDLIRKATPLMCDYWEDI